MRGVDVHLNGVRDGLESVAHEKIVSPRHQYLDIFEYHNKNVRNRTAVCNDMRLKRMVAPLIHARISFPRLEVIEVLGEIRLHTITVELAKGRKLPDRVT